MSLWTREFSLINDPIILILKLYLSNKVYLLQNMLLKINYRLYTVQQRLKL